MQPTTIHKSLKLLSLEQAALAGQTGRFWATCELYEWLKTQEAPVYFSEMPPWDLNRWMGPNPCGDKTTSDKAFAFDLALDMAAENVWEQVRNSGKWWDGGDLRLETGESV